jgi:hypothetical protein
MLVKLFAATLLLLVTITGLQLPQAQAWCCGCGCMYGCTCPGYWDQNQRKYCFSTCRSTDPVLQTKAPIDGSTDQLGIVDGSLPSSDLRSDFLQRVTEVRALTPCLRHKIALSLLGDSQEAMKFELMRFDENAKRETVAFQMDRQ